MVLSKSRFSWIKTIVFDKKEEDLSSDDNSRNSIEKNILEVRENEQINASKLVKNEVKKEKVKIDKTDNQFLIAVIKKIFPLPLNVFIIYV